MKTTEKFKKGLEACAAGECRSKRHECPYRNEGECTMALSEDALALICQLESKLAEYEKPLELDKAKELRICWIEEIDEGVFPAIYEAKGNGGIYAVFTIIESNDDWDEHYWAEVSEYGSCWRCWPRKPTDEERKAAKWDE